MAAPLLVISSLMLPGIIISFHVLKALVSFLSVRSPYTNTQQKATFPFKSNTKSSLEVAYHKNQYIYRQMVVGTSGVRIMERLMYVAHDLNK